MLFVLKRIARRLDGRLLSFPMLQSGAPGSEISVVTMVMKQVLAQFPSTQFRDGALELTRAALEPHESFLKACYPPG